MADESPITANATTGSGGELHQTADGASAVMTTQQGIPVADDQNSLKAGARGPTLLEDFHLREKIFHFDHERIPERVVHARGYGAHGFFETYESLSDITKADVFARAGDRVPAFVRFSTVAGSKGSPVTSGGLPSSFTPRRATGTSSATTSRYFSFRTPLSFRISFTPPSRRQTGAFPKHRRRMITSGILFR